MRVVGPLSQWASASRVHEAVGLPGSRNGVTDNGLRMSTVLWFGYVGVYAVVSVCSEWRAHATLRSAVRLRNSGRTRTKTA